MVLNRATFALPLFVGLLACGDNRAVNPDACRSNCGTSDAPVDAKPLDASPDANPLMPATLAETGLCANASCTQINSGIWTYTPRWPLFTDGASKKRWIALPPGGKIDSSDMNYWKFPVGTKLWKEFTRDGIRVETRYMLKTGPLDTDWFFMAYGWNASQDATVAKPSGELNANGTMHDIPGRSLCRQCHDREPGRVLGFAALQLDVPATGSDIDLTEVLAENLLTVAPTGAGATKFPLPGTAREQDALGYMHANCGHCHNPKSDVHAARPIELMMQTDRLDTLANTPTYATAVNVDGAPINGVTMLIKPGDTDGTQSLVMIRMKTAVGAYKMPLLGTETVDQAAVTTLQTWIANIP